MDWKSIFEKVLVAVLAGLVLGLLGWLGTWIIGSSNQILAAQTDWIDVPNPAFGNVDSKKVDALNALGLAFFNFNGLSIYANVFRSEPRLRIGRITIKNLSDTRSKEIEVSNSAGMVFSRAQQGHELPGFGEKILLNPIEPEKSVDAFYISIPWFSFMSVPVTVIHDNRIVDILALKSEDLPFISTRQAQIVVGGAIALAVIGGMLVLILIVSGLVLLFVKDRAKFQAWNLTKKQVKKSIEVLDAVKKYYPEKLPT